MRASSFVLNRKSEVLCFLLVAKFVTAENRSFVLNRNWWFGGVLAGGRAAQRFGVTALDRRLVVCEIFTDSSSSYGARNAKRCVCTGSSRCALATERYRHGSSTTFIDSASTDFFIATSTSRNP